MQMLPDSTYWLTRFYFQRALGGIYLLGFLIAANQFTLLCGREGLLPFPLFLKRVKFWQAPSLFRKNTSDRFVKWVAWVGVILSVAAMTGISDAFSPAVSISIWLTLWVLYSSFVNLGQVFYSYGWEILLLETGFLAIFLGNSRSAPPVIVIYLLRWLLFRVMLGAGLIKIRGDACWRDLSCLQYHYETMPIPGPTSRWFFNLPVWVHTASVLLNHFVELIVPFFYFAPSLLRNPAGILTILFQCSLIVTGNFSWLNHLTVVIALVCFNDAFLKTLLSWLTPWASAMGVATFVRLEQVGTAVPLAIAPAVIYGLAGVIAILSIQPIRNLCSRRQIMNTSFDPLHWVNTYGAFGTVTKTRHEVILEGSDSEDGPWTEYEFKAKPGRLSRTPPFVSPYHFKLDWQMWFAAMTPPDENPWLLHLMAKLLSNGSKVSTLMAPSPLFKNPPKFIRASLYRYEYAKLPDPNPWIRKYESAYLPVVSLNHPQFREMLKQEGWNS